MLKLGSLMVHGQFCYLLDVVGGHETISSPLPVVDLADLRRRLISNFRYDTVRKYDPLDSQLSLTTRRVHSEVHTFIS